MGAACRDTDCLGKDPGVPKGWPQGLPSKSRLEGHLPRVAYGADEIPVMKIWTCAGANKAGCERSFRERFANERDYECSMWISMVGLTRRGEFSLISAQTCPMKQDLVDGYLNIRHQ